MTNIHASKLFLDFLFMFYQAFCAVVNRGEGRFVKSHKYNTPVDVDVSKDSLDAWLKSAQAKSPIQLNFVRVNAAIWTKRRPIARAKDATAIRRDLRPSGMSQRFLYLGCRGQANERPARVNASCKVDQQLVLIVGFIWAISSNFAGHAFYLSRLNWR